MYVGGSETGPRVKMWWWEKEGLDLEGMRIEVQEADRVEGGEGDGQDGDCDGRLVK